MCGIAGSFRGQVADLEVCLQRMAHRGPDGQDIQSYCGNSLAHARLAIVDVDGGHQPMSSADDSRWLVCNGEIYNHPYLRAQHPDYPFKTHSDSEDILALYQRYGTQMVNHLQGMFAFALLDDAGMLLGRDPLGIKPLYYGLKDDRVLYFASEIKALQGIADTIHEFPPGHWFSPQDGFVRYYDLNTKIEAFTLSELPSPTLTDIRETLREVVHSHLMSDVPLGVFLSGGLDSSIIAALVCEELPNVHSFAVGMEGSPDLDAARQVARFLGTQHHEHIYTEQEMRDVLSDVIYYLESFDPALVRSAVANYFLAKLASQHVTVILSGEGADELFSGYSYLRRFETASALQQELVGITTGLHNRNLQRLDRMTMAHSIEGRVPFLDTRFVERAFNVPIEQKLSSDGIEKRILRQAFADLLPEKIVWRSKQKFAEGAGSAGVFEQIAEYEINDAQFVIEAARIQRNDSHAIRSKEELYYYNLFRRFYDASVVPLVGFSRSL